ncbi:MAG TPA: carboxypeptidase-like regulatory domain-containing protein, partial [Candidatus Binatia bacterium]|nr:carboxypeptidase-like regulatory domain-containing protein [Candidatus Binatia bacterium]
FTVTTGYSVNAAPASVQEGGSLTLTANITGGQKGISYSANIVVVLPTPLNITYSKIVNLGTPNEKGTASIQLTFPDTSFTPSGSLTAYAGIYTVYFNQSQSLAQSTFTVNFIDAPTYHRGQTVTVRATGYTPNNPATITITSVKSGSNPLNTISATASADGIISANWVVPPTADVGDYTIKITSQNTPKLLPDSQSFTIPGYAVKVQTSNLAGEVVTAITIQAEDAVTNATYSAASSAVGVATLNVESGSQVLTALWNGVNVGEKTVTVTGDETFSIQCQLTDVKFTVKNTNGVLMPFVSLAVTFQYQSGGATKTGSASGQTDSSGSYTLNSTLPSANYLIDASVYNEIFNAGNNTVSNLPAMAIVQVFIICPSETISLTVVGYNQEAIPEARIELVELSNGLFYSATTDSNGVASAKTTFGNYRARIYEANTLINETNIQVFSNSQQQIRCTLFGIQLSVEVVDFFGNPISNVNVTMNGPTKLSAFTKSDGKATFDDIIGGNMQLIVMVPGTPDAYQATTLSVNQPASLQIRMDKYVALGSMLMQVSSLITILIIVVAVILFALVEFYRRRRTKHATAF